MRVVPPVTVTSATLTSSTCAEPHATETAYNSGTTYALGAEVISTTTHKTYESLQAGNLNKALTNTDWWLEVGPSNRYKMFDLDRNSGTVQASPLSVVITPGRRINAVGLVGLVAEVVAVSVTSGGVPVYFASDDLRTRSVSGWKDYFFEPFSYKTSTLFLDIPPYVNAVITILLTRAAGDVTCGGVVIGNDVYIGTTIHSAERSALNFSTISRDEFGDTELIPRRSVPKTTQNVIADKDRVPRLLRLVEELNAVPALWTGIDDTASGYFEPLLILGVYKRFDINMDQPENATVTLELEEI